MQGKWQKLLVLAVVAAVVAGAALIKKGPSKPVGVAVQQAAQSSKLPTMVEIGSTKCIPCKAMMPIVDSLEKNYKGQLHVQFIDFFANRKAAEKYKVNKIPTQIFLDADGKELARHTGFYPEAEIIKTFDKHGIKLESPGKAE